MAAGLPVITARRGGTPEVVTHGFDGIVIKDFRNPASYARAINDLFANPEKAGTLARRGRLTVEKRFTYERMAEGYMNVYQQVCEKNKAHKV